MFLFHPKKSCNIISSCFRFIHYKYYCNLPSLKMSMSNLKSPVFLDVEETVSWKDKLNVKSKKENKMKPNITKMQKSNLMNNIKNFLPQLQMANSKLNEEMLNKHPENFDIENTEGCEKVIEMDLAMMPELLDTPIGELLLPNSVNSDSNSSSSEEEECQEIKLTPATTKNKLLIEEV